MMLVFLCCLLFNSLNKSLSSTPSKEEKNDSYLRFMDQNGKEIKGVKLHIDTETLHLYGFIVNKKVIMPGVYPKVNSRPLTKAKKKLQSKLAVSKFRQFKLTPEQVNSISVENLSLLPPK